MDNYLWNIEDVKKATSGRASRGEWQANGVSIDSRNIKEADLFVAIRGTRFDGHNYVEDAIKAGAVAAIVDKIDDSWDNELPVILVEDSFQALKDMAAYNRKRFKGKVIGVTGSVGKTSTKEMLKLMLSVNDTKCFASAGNFNNHFGVPLSLCNMPADSDYAIFEMGMNHAGEIKPLSMLTKPDVAIITNVEAVHLEFFESVEQIAGAKSEIFAGLSKNSSIVLNKDNEFFNYLVTKAKDLGFTDDNIVSFGADENAQYRLLKYLPAADIVQVTADLDGQKVFFVLELLGEDHVKNALAALAAINRAGADPKFIVENMPKIGPTKGRGDRYSVNLEDGGNYLVIDDTYNASPVSVRASIKNLSALAGSNSRSILVLGDMFELGSNSIKMHAELSKTVLLHNIDLVFTVGKLTKNLYDALPDDKKGGCFEDSETGADEIYQSLKDGDVVLVKGSRGMKMENIVNYILQQEVKQKDAV